MDDGLPVGAVATPPSGAGPREEGVAFRDEEPAQERPNRSPVLPTPTKPVEIIGVAESIAEPEAAKPRKAGPAKGKAKTAKAKSEKSETKNGAKNSAKYDAKYGAKSKGPTPAAAKGRLPKMSSKRRGKG